MLTSSRTKICVLILLTVVVLSTVAGTSCSTGKTALSVFAAAGAKPGYFVGELLDPHLPADLSYSNIVPGTGVEFWMPAWRPVVALAGDQFGVAMSLNEGWLDDGVSADDPTMGLWLASHDDSDPDPLFDWFAPLDHFEQAFIDCDSGAPLPLLGYGGANCSPPDPTPEASIYMKLWYKFEDCNHNGIPDDQDIAWGTSVDCNGNGIPDECEPGDIDGDGDVDLSDFATFALCYAGAGVTVPPPSCSEAWFCSSDLDGDDDVDLSDFAIFALNYTG